MLFTVRLMMLVNGFGPKWSTFVLKALNRRMPPSAEFSFDANTYWPKTPTPPFTVLLVPAQFEVVCCVHEFVARSYFARYGCWSVEAL